jgi:glutamine---fructose-6-phosphate transaminase (isomerizing)
VLAIAPPGRAQPGVLDAVAEAGRRGAPTLTIAEDLVMPEWLSPLGAVVPAQLLAAALAERRGIDIDRPFGLQKVTRTT